MLFCADMLNLHFWWRCSQLLHGPSDHGVKAYQVSFRSKFGRDTATEPILGRLCHSPTFEQRSIKNMFSKFCSAQSKDDLSQFWEE